MRKYFYFFIILLATPLVVLGAGGGSGGSIVACDQDTWICTGWGECSAQGTQKRSCSISFDCPNIETARPDESQNCAPPCSEDTWQCSEWGVCSSEGKQTRLCELLFDCKNVTNIEPLKERECEIANNVKEETRKNPEERNPFAPLPAEPQKVIQKNSSIVGCDQDRWDCGPWSNECDSSGNHTRACKITIDCPNVDTPPPQYFKKCERLQCGDKNTIKERALCRLGLSPAAITREYEIQYLPEECKFIKNENKRFACIKKYKDYKPCWARPIGFYRNECARQSLGLGQDVRQEMSNCLKETGKKVEQCKLVLKEKVFEMIKFRFYDLEERAEDLIKQGADKDAVADFVVFISEKKNEFNNATTKNERKEIIQDVRDGWKKFLEKVKPSLKISNT